MFHSLTISIVVLFPLVSAMPSHHEAMRNTLAREFRLSDNTSVLPPGWSGSALCMADCGDSSPLSEFMFGPAFTNTTSMTIELCVSFCDQQGSRMAGLLGPQCRCSNIWNPATCFESDPGECEPFGQPCPGNPYESCGSVGTAPDLINTFSKIEGCNLFPGFASLTSGSWRLVSFYNDSITARALPHNAVDIHPSLPRGNLTIETCVNACGTAGFLLAGVEFADECYCGDELENNSQSVFNCSTPDAMPCKGNPEEFCGGPDLLYVYSLPGTGLSPLVPFDAIFDNFCSEGACNSEHT
ncbi:hypothetical protein K439DRAFT_1660665 [Ramaria rubella]|nr:hypothetical protein K439DRAFT_1660665 [Ramaria rubella]